MTSDEVVLTVVVNGVLVFSKKALGRHMENKEALPMVSVATAS